MSNYRNNYSQVAAEQHYYPQQQQQQQHQRRPQGQSNQMQSSQGLSQQSQGSQQQYIHRVNVPSGGNPNVQSGTNYAHRISSSSHHVNSGNSNINTNTNPNPNSMNYRNVSKQPGPNLAQVVASPQQQTSQTSQSSPSQQVSQQQQPPPSTSSQSNNLPSSQVSSQQQQQQQVQSKSSGINTNITSSSQPSQQQQQQQQQQSSPTQQLSSNNVSQSQNGGGIIPSQLTNVTSSSSLSSQQVQPLPSSSSQQLTNSNSPNQQSLHPPVKQKPIVQNQSDKIMFYGTKYEVKCDETFAFYDGSIVDYDPKSQLFQILYGWKNPQDVPLHYIRPCAPKTNYDTWRPKVGDRVECKAKAEEREPFGWWDARIRVANEHAFQYMIQFEGWNEDHDEILRLEMLRPYNPFRVLSEEPPYSYHEIVRDELDISHESSSDVQQMIKSVTVFELPNVKENSNSHDDNKTPIEWLKSNEIQQWAIRATYEISFIKNRTKVIHIGYRPDVHKFIMIGTQSQVEDAKILLKHAIITQSKLSSLEKKLKKQEQNEQNAYNELKNCVSLKFPYNKKFFEAFDTDPKMFRLNSFMRNNMRAAREIDGVKLIRQDTNKYEFLILAIDHERAQEAKELIDMEIQTTKVPRKVLRDLIGENGQNIRSLEQTSGVNKICTVKNYAVICKDHDYDVDEDEATEITMVVVGPKVCIPMAITLLQNDVERLQKQYELKQRSKAASKELNKNGFGEEYQDWYENANANVNENYNENTNTSNMNNPNTNTEYFEEDYENYPPTDEQGNPIDMNENYNGDETQTQSHSRQQRGGGGGGGQRYYNNNYNNYNNRGSYNRNYNNRSGRGGGGGSGRGNSNSNRGSYYNNNGYNANDNNNENTNNTNYDESQSQQQHVSQRRRRQHQQQHEYYADDQGVVNGNYETDEPTPTNNNNNNNNNDNTMNENQDQSPSQQYNKSSRHSGNDYRGRRSGGGGGNVSYSNYRNPRNYNSGVNSGSGNGGGNDNVDDSSSPSNTKWQKKETMKQSESVDNEQQ